jgi:hypothetical protein
LIGGEDKEKACLRWQWGMTRGVVLTLEDSTTVGVTAFEAARPAVF